MNLRLVFWLLVRQQVDLDERIRQTRWPIGRRKVRALQNLVLNKSKILITLILLYEMCSASFILCILKVCTSNHFLIMKIWVYKNYIVVLYGLPNCTAFCFVGSQQSKVENHCLKLNRNYRALEVLFLWSFNILKTNLKWFNNNSNIFWQLRPSLWIPWSTG